MSKRIVVVLLGMLTAAPAVAQTRGQGGDWSILGAETLAPGTDAVYGAAGWPDVSFGWTHGVQPNFDIGLKMSMLYGIENTTDSQFGMAFAAPLRWTLARRANAVFMLHVDPGVRFYTTDPFAFGFQVPFGLNVEFPIKSVPLKVGLGADFNASLFVSGGNSPSFFFGPLIGPYVEYHIDRDLAIGLDTRFGPVVDAYSGNDFYGGGTETRFGFRAQMILAYHL